MARKKETLHFDPFSSPARRHWQIDATIDREIVPEFLEHLEDLCVPDRGARFYFPRKDGTTRCRFEWSWRTRAYPRLLRLGVMFDVDSKELGPIEGFVTTNNNIRHPGTDAPELPEKVTRSATKRVHERLQRALDLALGDATKVYDHVLHFRCGGGLGVGDEITLFEGTTKIFPSVIVRDRRRENERISAVVYRVDAATPKAAKLAAKAQHALTCALATLTTHLTFSPYNPRSTRRRRRPEFIDSMDAPAKHLYPNHIPLPEHEASDELSRALPRVVEAFGSLTTEAADVFTGALLAYVGGREIQGNQGTLACVSFIAALNRLAEDYLDECPGVLSCTEHGPLSWRHRNRGDAAAITELGSELLGIEKSSEDYKALKALVRTTYSVHRSAFVHGAELRHGEHDQRGLPSAAPSHRGCQFSSLATYAHDLDSIAHLTRRLLLAWLERQSGNDLELGHFSPDGGIRRSRSFDASTHTSPSGSTIRLAPYSPGELEALKAEWAASREGAGSDDPETPPELSNEPSD